MKYNHRFEPIKIAPSYREYKEGGVKVRLDFFEHILRVAIIRDNEELLPTYTVCPEPRTCDRFGNSKLDVTGFKQIIPLTSESRGKLTLYIDDVLIDVNLHNFRLKCSNQKGLLFEDREYISYNFEHELGAGSTHYITREEDEYIYGLGDKSGHVNKNGMAFKLSASDAMGFDARTSDPLYKHLPFYICENKNGAYGIYYDTYSQGEITFGKERNQYYSLFKGVHFEEENLVYYVIFGSVAEIVQRFSAMCGPILTTPAWSLKYCGSTMAYTDAPDADAKMRGFIELCEKYGIKAGGFYMSSGYTQIGEKRYVFHWNTDKIPSPENLASYYKEHGVELIPNVKPAFLTDHPMYEEIAKKGWFLHYKDGTPAAFPFWSGMGSYLDFTNPEAYDFWRECVKSQLVDRGFKHIWNDNNEYDVNDDEVYAYGFGNGEVRAKLIRPLFSFLMTMASVDAQDKEEPVFSVSRCGIGGLQRISTTWTGDNRTSFEDFRYNHYMAMTMSLSGFYNFGQDIGGFAGPCPSEELFMRWIQYGVFMPRFVLHSWNPDGSSNMPWLYPDLMPQVKKLFDFRERLVPYLYKELMRSVNKHEPIVYPVFLKEEGYDREADCFMCGDDILVCPVFDEGATEVTVDLPTFAEGWYYGERLLTGTQTFECPYDGMPVWLKRAGADLDLEM